MKGDFPKTDVVRPFEHKGMDFLHLRVHCPLRPEGGRSSSQLIATNIKEEGWTDQDHFSQDEDHYVRMGCFKQ